jgi:hypothetical protein
MKLDSVRELKSTAQAEAAADPHAFAAALGAKPGTELPMALGVSRGGGADDYQLTVITAPGHEAEAEAMSARASGESVVRVMRVAARITPAWLQRWGRPLEPGRSTGHGQVTAGSVGPIVKDDAGTLYALSNNHVFANTNAAQLGDPIYSPGPIDSTPSGQNLIGQLARFVRIRFDAPNLVDAALCLLRTTVLPGWNAGTAHVMNEARTIGPAELGMRVRKIGRTTGVRIGRVTSVELDRLPVSYGVAGTAVFNDQIEISGGRATDFSEGGDSGSGIGNRSAYVGLLFAGGRDNSGEDFTFANRIALALDALDVVLA